MKKKFDWDAATAEERKKQISEVMGSRPRHDSFVDELNAVKENCLIILDWLKIKSDFVSLINSGGKVEHAAFRVLYCQKNIRRHFENGEFNKALSLSVDLGEHIEKFFQLLEASNKPTRSKKILNRFEDFAKMKVEERKEWKDCFEVKIKDEDLEYLKACVEKTKETEGEEQKEWKNCFWAKWKKLGVGGVDVGGAPIVVAGFLESETRWMVIEGIYRQRKKEGKSCSPMDILDCLPGKLGNLILKQYKSNASFEALFSRKKKDWV